MIYELYAVYDKAVSAYTPPFMARSRGEALRSFTEACNDEKSNFAKFSSDYTLFYLGEFDDVSGAYMVPNAGPERVINAYECVVDDDKLALPPGELPKRVRM